MCCIVHTTFCIIKMPNIDFTFYHRYTVEEDGTLVIKKLNIEDSGMFQCEAENEAGSDSISTWLKVKSKFTQ